MCLSHPVPLGRGRVRNGSEIFQSSCLDAPLRTTANARDTGTAIILELALALSPGAPEACTPAPPASRDEAPESGAACPGMPEQGNLGPK